MIIWSGWGILVVVFAVIGAIVGGVSGAFLGSIGGGVVGGGAAAFLNFIVAKLVDQPKLLVDQQTGQQILQKKSNSLFFIPMSWFTPVFVLLGFGIGLIGFAAVQHEKAMDAKYPGKKMFSEASAKIDSREADVYHGNTESSQKAAQDFGDTLSMMVQMSFEDSSGQSTGKSEFFRTYCHRGENGVIFLCHVPDMRSYKDASVKKALGDLAWASAKAAAKSLPDVSDQTPMLVGLRGFSSYGVVINGSISGDPMQAPDGETSIYLAFDPTVKGE